MLEEMTSYQDSRALQHYFSSEQLPTLWRALPAIEALQSAWEAKHDDRRFAIYYDAINEGLAKLQKYYSQFDEKPSYVLALGKRPSNLSPSRLICIIYSPSSLLQARIHQDGVGWCKRASRGNRGR
jgi:hypothetical protein